MTILLSIIFTFPSYGDWKFTTMNTDLVSYYLDYKRIRKNNGYVYYWVLEDRLLKPNELGGLSTLNYNQGDCNLFRFKNLSQSQYEGKMGAGRTVSVINVPDENWTYPQPKKIPEIILQVICNHIK